MSDYKTWLSEGIIIASIPVAGYWIAFLYELGYCRYYDIPPIFHEVGLSNTFFAIIGICSFLIIYFLIFDSIFPFFSSLPKPLMRIIRRNSLALLIVYGLSIVNKFSLRSTLIVIIPFCVLLLNDLIAPLLWHRKTKGYIAKLEKYYEKESQSKSFFDYAASKVGKYWFALIYYLYIASIGAYVAGGYNAKHEEDFIVIPKTPEIVVLKQYNNCFLAVDLDRKTKVVIPKFQKIDIVKELSSFKYERIGPLIPEGLSKKNGE